MDGSLRGKVADVPLTSRLLLYIGGEYILRPHLHAFFNYGITVCLGGNFRIVNEGHFYPVPTALVAAREIFSAPARKILGC